MSFLAIADVDGERIRKLVTLGATVKANRDEYRNTLDQRAVGLFFQKQSLRTWVSCDIAAIQLGAHPIAIRNEQTGLGSRETPEDVGQVLGRYLDLLAMRVFDHTDLTAIDVATEIPIVNLLSDLEHPCQAIADMMTIAEHKPIAESIVTYVGDGNNVCHSLVLAAAALGAEVRVVTPKGYEPNPMIIEAAAAPSGVTVTNELSDGVSGADVVYTDVWTSMGQEAEQAKRLLDFAGYQIGGRVFDLASSDAVFMHCLPAHRGEEVTHEMMDHPRSVVFDQAENRLHSFKAILLDELA